jgi:serine/threonine-protein kinase
MEALHWYRAGQGRHRRRTPTKREDAAAGTPPEQRRLDGRYRLIELVARGGWSTVWRGYDERLSRPVAIKLVDASQARSVQGEAIALAKLAHPHIATVYDYGRTASEYFIVLEFVEGRSLAEILEVGPLPWPDAVRNCADVASALAAAHRRGLVHRDVTPGNIMLTSSGVKLIDFGLSVVEGESETDRDGQARGTPAYVAPERLTGTVVTPASDVFGLGAVLYRAIAGYPPWQGATVTELLTLQATTEPAPLPPIDGLPDAVVEVCERCLSRQPAERPTAAEMSNLLADVASAVPTTPVQVPAAEPPPASVPAQGRGAARVFRWVTAAFVVLLLGGFGWVLAGWGPGGDSITSSLVNPVEPGPPAPGCVVAYQLTSPPGQPFAATVTVTNTGTALPPGWRLSYHTPPGVDPAPSAVASEPRSPLGHGGSVQLSLTAATPAADAGTFQVNGHPCLAVSFPFAAEQAPTAPAGSDPVLAPVGQSDAQSSDAPTARPKPTKQPHSAAANDNRNGNGNGNGG